MWSIRIINTALFRTKYNPVYISEWAEDISTYRQTQISFNNYLFIWLCWVLVTACRVFSCSMWTLSCIMWDLIPWSGMEPGLLASEPWSLSHWTTREVPHNMVFVKILTMLILFDWWVDILPSPYSFAPLPWPVGMVSDVSDFFLSVNSSTSHYIIASMAGQDFASCIFFSLLLIAFLFLVQRDKYYSPIALGKVLTA